MGFLKDYFWDDKPCLRIRKIVIDDEPRTIKLVQDDDKVKKLITANKELKNQLRMKKVNAIDVDYKLLE